MYVSVDYFELLRIKLIVFQVLNDADLESAAKFIIDGTMLHSGQGCIATERVIVTREVSQTLIEHITTLTKKLKAGGDGQLGGLFCRAAAENVIGMIKDALNDGAQLLVGDLKAEGVVVQPHVVLGTKPGSRLWDMESFGPGKMGSTCDLCSPRS